jgi:hypothetical protein
MTHPMQFEFNGSLTKADSKTYRPYTFEVPAGTTNVHVDFKFAPFYSSGRIHRNQIDLGINDPDGIRGVWCIIKPEGFDVNAVASTPGIATAPIQPGTWTVHVAAHRILAPDTVHYTLTITLSDAPIAGSAKTYDQPKTQKGAGWYRGDLHGHTIHSDGSWDIPEFTQFMRNVGLDFVTLSDHNTVTGLAQHRSQTDDQFLAMGGMELSTFNGHMLALGRTNYYEWRLGIRPDVDIHYIAQKAVDDGALLIIAHPHVPDEPFCSGCLWQFDDFRPGIAHGVEIWNGYWNVFNEDGLQQFYVWLNQGYRLSATSGSDIHGPMPTDPTQSDPTRRAGFNVVYAEELSEPAILAAVRQGHSYISGGPELLLNATTASGMKGMAGDQLPSEALTLSVKWNGAHDGDLLRLIVEGKVYETMPATTSGEHQWSFDAGHAKWYTVELRDAKHGLWAVSNPIFFGERS